MEIPVFKPLIESGEFNAVNEALEIGWLGMGAAVGEFENQVSKYLGSLGMDVSLKKDNIEYSKFNLF